VARVDSRVFLRHVAALLTQRYYRVVNVDTTVLAEAPRLGKFREAIRNNIAADLGITIEQVSIKATTSEGLGLSANVRAGLSRNCLA